MGKELIFLRSVSFWVIAQIALSFFTLEALCGSGLQPTTDSTPTVSIKNSEVSALFGLTNVGDRPLSVVKIHSSCSCQKFNFESPSIPPAGKGELKVNIPISYFRSFGSKLTFFVEDSDNNVIGPLAIQLPIDYQLGERNPVYLTWTGDDPKKLESIIVGAISENSVTLKSTKGDIRTFSPEFTKDSFGITSVNFRIAQKNPARSFAIFNISYHKAVGKNQHVPSEHMITVMCLYDPEKTLKKEL